MIASSWPESENTDGAWYWRVAFDPQREVRTE
jgi:hypothetical protein